MKKRKVLIQKEIITDCNTGEIISDTRKEVFEQRENYKQRETFKFMPEYSEIYLNIQGGTHHKVGYLLLDYQNKFGEVHISKSLKDDIGKILNISTRMVELSIKELVISNVLTPISKGKYIINPMFIYKGGTLNLQNKINDYNNIRMEYESKKQQ